MLPVVPNTSRPQAQVYTHLRRLEGRGLVERKTMLEAAGQTAYWRRKA